MLRKEDEHVLGVLRGVGWACVEEVGMSCLENDINVCG